MVNSENQNSSGSAPSLLDSCTAEIEGLHQFFEDWLGGKLPDTDEAFRRLDRALAEDFRLVHPSGKWRSRGDILTELRRANGSQPGLKIEIRDVRLREAGEELVGATYEEWQWGEEREDGRLSTALFRRTSEAPNGLRWLHVHETWLSAPE